MHTGEVELLDSDIGGVAVHLAARVCDAAEPGEVLVTRTVEDLLIGSELRFGTDRSINPKGFVRRWDVVPPLPDLAGRRDRSP
ncbi:MAG: hypothetical protein ACR2HQ_08285 [Ilumatobacteraceae bacterium]